MTISAFPIARPIATPIADCVVESAGGGGATPLLSHDWTVDQSIPAWMTYTRSGPQYYLTSAGLVGEESNDNVATYSYENGAHGQNATVAQTLTFLHNSDFTQTEWVKTNMSAALDLAGADVDETANTASTLTATGADATALQTVTAPGGSGWSHRFFIKRITGTGNIYLRAPVGGTPADLDITSEVDAGGGDWVLISTRYGYDGGGTFEAGIKLATSGDAVGVFRFCPLYGNSYPQLAPVGGTAVTLNAPNFNSDAQAGNLDPNAGTMVAKVYQLGASYTGMKFWRWEKSGGGDSTGFSVVTNNYYAEMKSAYTANVAQIAYNGAVTARELSDVGFAFCFSTDNGVFYVDGVSRGTEVTSTTLPIGGTWTELDPIYLTNGLIRSIAYYTSDETAQAATLSTPFGS